jgi:DNA-binding NarL/FixJ family response regulator
MIDILVADDHSLIRRGIAAILSPEADMRIAAEASTGEEALDLARSRHFDVAILDINMPGRGGLEIVRELLDSCPELKVIILSMYPAEHYAVRSFKDGALAYLTKDKAEAQLAEAIRRVASGRRYVTPEAAERLARYVENEAGQALHEKLSTRELQILTLIGAGLSVS